MARSIRSIILNLTLSVAGYYGIILNVEWARNIFMFYVWVAFVASTLILCVDKARLEVRSKGRSMPRWFAVSNDIFGIVILAATGRFISAGAMLWSMIAESSIYEGEN